MSQKEMSKQKLNVLAALGVLAGIVLIIGIRYFYDGGPVGRAVSRHLKRADEQAAAGLDPQLTPIKDLFAKARAGTRAFADEAISFDSKVRFVCEWLSGSDEHKKYLHERFEAHVFSQKDLEKCVQCAVRAYLTHLDDVDAMLLVNLKADLENIPSSNFTAGVDRSVIEESMRTAIREAVSAVESDFPATIGLEVASFIAGEVLTAATIEMAASAGILSAGATSGTVTFGVGLVVGVIVDAIIGWAWDAIADPKGKLSKKLNGTLTDLEKLIVDGNGKEPGLTRRLSDYAARRSEARSKAIRSVVTP